MVEYTDEVEDNIIIEVMQKGYMLHDRVIKPSLVKVAKKTSGQPQ
jgi:molecular chaperone GrpE